MKAARLIKFQEKAECRAVAATVSAPPQKAVRYWLSEYQQQKQANPREQFARLFKRAA
jgi:hypothetical protein